MNYLSRFQLESAVAKNSPACRASRPMTLQRSSAAGIDSTLSALLVGQIAPERQPVAVGIQYREIPHPVMPVARLDVRSGSTGANTTEIPVHVVAEQVHRAAAWRFSRRRRAQVHHHLVET